MLVIIPEWTSAWDKNLLRALFIDFTIGSVNSSRSDTFVSGHGQCRLLLN